MNQACVDCPRSLVCVGGNGGACMGGALSMCPTHDIVCLWESSGTVHVEHKELDADGAVKHVIDRMATGVNWKEQNYFAELLGVACNCKAAEICPRITLMAPPSVPRTPSKERPHP